MRKITLIATLFFSLCLSGSVRKPIIVPLDKVVEVAQKMLTSQEKKLASVAETLISECLPIVMVSHEESRTFTLLLREAYSLVGGNTSDFYTKEAGKYYIFGRKSNSETVEARKRVVAFVETTFGLREWTDPYEEVEALILRVRDRLTYDDTAALLSTEEAVKQKRGVCVHFATIFYILANAEHLPTKLVMGTYCGEPHMWAETLLNDNIVTVDPTAGGRVSDEVLWKYVKYE